LQKDYELNLPPQRPERERKKGMPKGGLVDRRLGGRKSVTAIARLDRGRRGAKKGKTAKLKGRKFVPRKSFELEKVLKERRRGNFQSGGET